jgi:hypothetical protein
MARITPGRPGHRRAALLLAAALLVHPAAARAKGPGALDKEKGTFAPGGSPVAAYGAEAGKCPTGGPARTVERDLEEAAKKAGRPAPRQTPTLCALAETFLGWDPGALGKPGPAVLVAASHWFGLAAPVGEILVATIEGLPGDDLLAADAIAEKVIEPAGRFALNAAAPRWGMATQRIRRDVVKVALALQDEPATVKGLPRRLEAGGAARLEVATAPGVKDPRILVSDPRGALTDVKGASAEVRCGPVPGLAVVELRGEVDGQQMVIGSFPVGCGVDLPASVRVAPEAWPAAPEQQEARLLERLNAERAAVGLAPVAADRDVAGRPESPPQHIGAVRLAAARGVAEEPTPERAIAIASISSMNPIAPPSWRAALRNALK